MSLELLQLSIKKENARKTRIECDQQLNSIALCILDDLRFHSVRYPGTRVILIIINSYKMTVLWYVQLVQLVLHPCAAI